MYKHDLGLRWLTPVSLPFSDDHRRAERRFLLLLLLSLCLYPSFASAQVSATLSGIVTDQSGAAVPARKCDSPKPGYWAFARHGHGPGGKISVVCSSAWTVRGPSEEESDLRKQSEREFGLWSGRMRELI